jgi:hypothetical protein
MQVKVKQKSIASAMASNGSNTQALTRYDGWEQPTYSIYLPLQYLELWFKHWQHTQYWSTTGKGMAQEQSTNGHKDTRSM